MEVTIRLGGFPDASAISAFLIPLAARFIAQEFDADARSRFLETFSPAAIEGYIRDGFRYHLAEHAGALVGVVATREDSHLYHLFVAESAHRSGLGTRLWQVARDASLASGYRGDFTVKSSQFAVGFYEQLGFKRAGPEQNQDGVISVPMRLRWRPA
jgi:ribosomal protein S18 acetylase RimI-like enzyme